MSFARFETLLKQTMGLDASTVGASMIERAVRDRMAAASVADADAYWNLLHVSTAELQELIETVIVPETWFFRGHEAFDAMARLACERALRKGSQPLRFLSLPCSTGEEPYSIAMALFDAGLPAARFHIDAVDICTRSLAIAGRAVYGRNSFRGKSLDFRARHFSQTEDGYVLSETVRRQVRFQSGNMFDADFLTGFGAYDFIFCRNLLIYFDRPMQERAVAVLNRLLSQSGLLFAGPAEAGLMVRQDMVSAGLPLAFAFRKADAALPVLKPWAPPPKPLPPTAPPTAAVRPVPRAVTTAPAPPPPRPAADAIDTARQMANQGQLVEAAALCKRQMQLHGPSAALLCLLGVISDAAGNRGEAREHYRRALYLDPDHYESLSHLAALLQMQGDAAGARRMDERAGRSRAKQGHA
ncbi:MAG: cheR2 [Herminiimonas sp.]|nr:cheR2 [Herminiimonas sp.]